MTIKESTPPLPPEEQMAGGFKTRYHDDGSATIVEDGVIMMIEARTWRRNDSDLRVPDEPARPEK